MEDEEKVERVVDFLLAAGNESFAEVPGAWHGDVFAWCRGHYSEYPSVQLMSKAEMVDWFDRAIAFAKDDPDELVEGLWETWVR